MNIPNNNSIDFCNKYSFSPIIKVAYPSCYKFTTAIVTQVIATDITYCKSILHSGFANKHILSHLQIPVYRCVHVTTHHPENQWSVILMFYITLENKTIPFWFPIFTRQLLSWLYYKGTYQEIAQKYDGDLLRRNWQCLHKDPQLP